MAQCAVRACSKSVQSTGLSCVVLECTNRLSQFTAYCIYVVVTYGWWYAVWNQSDMCYHKRCCLHYQSKRAEAEELRKSLNAKVDLHRETIGHRYVYRSTSKYMISSIIAISVTLALLPATTRLYGTSCIFSAALWYQRGMPVRVFCCYCK
jgi:hypothetical protein